MALKSSLLGSVSLLEFTHKSVLFLSSSMLSLLIYLIGLTVEEALTRRPSPLAPNFLLPPRGSAQAHSLALRPHVSVFIPTNFMHFCTLNSG